MSLKSSAWAMRGDVGGSAHATTDVVGASPASRFIVHNVTGTRSKPSKCPLPRDLKTDE